MGTQNLLSIEPSQGSQGKMRHPETTPETRRSCAGNQSPLWGAYVKRERSLIPLHNFNITVNSWIPHFSFQEPPY
jgi:hypothetical protein